MAFIHSHSDRVFVNGSLQLSVGSGRVFDETFEQAKERIRSRVAGAQDRMAVALASVSVGHDDQIDIQGAIDAAARLPQTASFGSMRYDVQTDSWSSGATIWGRPGEIESRDTEQLRAVQAEVDEQWAEAEARWAFAEQSRSTRMMLIQTMFEERVRLSITDPRSIIFTSMS